LPEKKVCFVSQLNSDFPRPVELIDSFRKVRHMDLNCLMISLRKQPTEFRDGTFCKVVIKFDKLNSFFKKFGLQIANSLLKATDTGGFIHS